MRRMDRYHQDDDNHLSRLDKNQELYQNLSNNIVYASITDVTNTNAYDITSKDVGSFTSREDYQKMQKYYNIENIPPSKKELDDFKSLYQNKDTKIYDINSVLEEARKNRENKDFNEDKKLLNNKAYNILINLNKEDLERYREEKKKRIMTSEEEEIRELIDTIASKTLAGEIDKATSVDLLSDLMATNIFDKVDSSSNISVDSSLEATVDEKESSSSSNDETSNDEHNHKSDSFKEEKEDNNKETEDFYSKSLDLSNSDIDLSMDFKEEQLPLFARIFIIIVILAMILAAIFFIYQRIH